MKKIVFIAKEFDQKVAHATALAALNNKVTLLIFDQLHPTPEQNKIEILTPYQNISPLLLIRLIPFFLNLQADMFHFITPSNMSWIEKTNWAFYISLLTSFPGSSVKITQESELTQNRLLLPNGFVENRETTNENKKSFEFDLLIPHTLSGLNEMQWDLLNNIQNSGVRILVWGWGNTAIHTRHELRSKFKIYDGNLKISNPSVDEKRFAFANAPALMVFNFDDGLFTESDLVQRATQKNAKIYFDRDLIEALKAPWRDSVNCSVLSRPFVNPNELALSWSNHSEMLSFLDQEENIRLRKWSLDAPAKLR